MTWHGPTRGRRVSPWTAIALSFVCATSAHATKTTKTAEPPPGAAKAGANTVQAVPKSAAAGSEADGGRDRWLQAGDRAYEAGRWT